MAVQWTENQIRAIETQGGTLLVSAAAGSGKTAVLVERVIRKITRETEPVDLDRLLVMTFSNAAASQMREKISARLFSLLEAEPDNLSYKRQQMLLPNASIGTVHAFCLKLIREHFSSLGISHEFRVADESEAAVLQDDAVKEVVEERYAAEDPDFADLVELTCGFRDDRKLLSLLKELLSFIRSHPFPGEWLSQKLALYDPALPLSDTVWAKRVLEYAKGGVEHAASLAKRASSLAGKQEKMAKAYLPALSDDEVQLREMLAAFESGDFDKVKAAVDSYSPKSLGRLTGFPNAAEKGRVQALRSEVKGIITALREECLVSDSAQFAKDIAWLRPKIGALFDTVLLFEERYAKLKRERGLLDFPDIEHMAIQLLVRPGKDGGYVKTSLAKELSKQFEEILVDEYQDTNEAQDMIFKALSQEEKNLFFVGDVKQSVYRFRQASPELFIEKRERFFPVSDGKFPAAVTLEKNFRSAKGITDGVNFLFRQLMTRETSGIDYTGEEELQCGNPYPPVSLPAFGLHLLEIPAGMDAGEAEARHVAAQIERHVSEGLLIREGDGQRPIRYGDFCILLRSVKGKSEVYEKALKERGIPVKTDREDSFFDRPEIMTAVSLLQVVSNPLQDVALTAVLASPLFAFSFDEIASLRLESPKKPLYLCVAAAAERGTERCVDFLRLIGELRELSAVLGVSEFIRQAYARTRLPLLYGAVSASARANLYLLLEYASSCEAAGYAGLTGFLRYLRRVKESGRGLPAVSPSAREDSVQIMSIHKSKGLEFPFCILADTAKQFNKQDLRQTALLHPRLGFSTLVREKDTMRQYTTVAHEAVKLELERDLLSEEMRVLYVALTRPKEHMLVTVSLKNPGKKLGELANGAADSAERLSSYAVRGAKSYGDWLLTAILRHPDADQLRERFGLALPVLPCEEPWEIRAFAAGREERAPEKEEPSLPAPDGELLCRLREQISWRYPFVTGLPAKLSVSQLSHEQQYDFAAAPSFLAGEGLSPAQRGTALHKVMQFADYGKARENLEKEIGRLAAARFLSSAEFESLDLKRLKTLFDSPLMGRILKSGRLLREVKFFYELPAGEYLGHELEGAGDSIILQGIADCVFFEGEEAVLVDYKTDRVRNGEELKERYALQLSLYREALEQGLGAKVKEMILYSVYLGRELLF